MIRLRLVLLSTIALWATPSPEPARAGDAGSRSAAPLVPLAMGKTMRIRGLDVVPLEATVPPNFKFGMEGPGEDFGDSAHLAGPDSVDVEIAPPDDGKFFSLAQQRKFLKDVSRPVSLVREQALPSGFAVVYEDKDAESKPEFGAIVSLPNLGVVCSAIFLHSLEDAELCVSICLSLRLAKRPEVNLSAVPPLTPLTDGQRVRIEGLKTVPLAITVPPKYKYRLGPSVTPWGPDAEFDGPGHTLIVVGPPRDWKFSTLSEQREQIRREHPSVTVVRADESPDGFVLIGLGSWTGGEYEYDVTVSRPLLKVVCGATPQKKLSNVERLASACLSLHAASDQER
jgi:hypothetical protein